MLSFFLTTIVLSSDSFFAAALLGPFINKKWRFAVLLGLFDGLAYFIGMMFPIAANIILLALLVLVAICCLLVVMNKIPPAIALALSADNLVDGLTRSNYLVQHGLLAKCFLSGTVLIHAVSLGLASFTAAALGILIVKTLFKSYYLIKKAII